MTGLRVTVKVGTDRCSLGVFLEKFWMRHWISGWEKDGTRARETTKLIQHSINVGFWTQIGFEHQIDLFDDGAFQLQIGNLRTS